MIAANSILAAGVEQHPGANHIRLQKNLRIFNGTVDMLPTVAALAAVTEEELLKLWEGLGYYSRARNLKLAAEKIMTDHNGLIPADFDILLTLPGIGRYTAGAISSIAYGKRVPAVDGNALRIIMRLLACRDDVLKEKTRRQVEACRITAISKMLSTSSSSFPFPWSPPGACQRPD